MNRFVSALNSAVYPQLPIFAQNAACTVGGWLRYRARFNSHFHRRLEEWEATEYSPEEELREIQRRRLDSLVTLARSHVPYYRDLPPPSDHPDPLEAIRRTLEAIPPLEKSAYRDQPRAFIARDVARIGQP